MIDCNLVKPGKGVFMSVKINSLFKDRLFKVIFGSPENKQNALSLYNALNGTDYKNPQDLTVYTIENAVYMGMSNDFSFILDGNLNLYEQQSTYNPNMPLRGLFYLSKQYEKYVEEHAILLYSPTRKKLPIPKYVVFFNGSTELPDRTILKLSDSFINKSDTDSDYVPSIEVRALLLNINAGKNRELLELCRPLMDYANFINHVKMNKDNGMTNEDAVEYAVDYAIQENYLDGWFKAHRAEAIGMILTEYDEKKVLQQLAEEYKEEGMAEGIEKGLDSMSALTKTLLTLNKSDELLKATSDPQYRDQLMRQYNII